MTKPTSFLIL